MSTTVTASFRRKLLRCAPLAALLAGAVATGMTVSPRPFRYDSWPKPPAPARVQTLVRVRPEAAVSDQTIAVARPAQRIAASPFRDTARARPASPRTATHGPVPRRSGSGGTGSTPGSNRARGPHPSQSPGTGTPPAGQPAGQPQQPAPAPSHDPAPPVQVAQAAPGTSPDPGAAGRQGLMAAVASTLHAAPPDRHGARAVRPHGRPGGLGADEADGPGCQDGTN